MPVERISRALQAGWGSASPTASRIVRVPSADHLPAVLAGASDRGVLARGLGRSYGDPSQNAGGDLIDMPSLPPTMHLHAEHGLLTAGAGVSLDQIMRTVVPLGFFVPVTPGTRFVTVGGAIAADIHGKNHHLDGTWGQHVLRFGLCLPDGTLREVNPVEEPALFWATVGGMGLTGVITDATIRLIPIETSRMLVHTEQAPDLDSIMALMEATDADYRYSVAWIDLLATGKRLGRSVLTAANHATLDALPASKLSDPLAFSPGSLLTAPGIVPSGMLNRMTIGAFNELWFRKAPKRRVGQVQGISTFFHPLDGIAQWNRLYGPRGFLQYQFVVPFGAEATLRRIVERLARSGTASFLAILKRFGAQNDGFLSFPMPGWTLTLDIPAGVPGLAELLDATDRDVLNVGGRLYFAKDSRMQPQMLAGMYPRIDAWRDIRDRVDPTRRLQSDLDRRVGLTRKAAP